MSGTRYAKAVFPWHRPRGAKLPLAHACTQ